MTRLLAHVQTIGFFRQRFRVTPRRFHHHQIVLAGLGSIFAAESFPKTVQLPLLELVVVVPAGSCLIGVGLKSVVTLARLAVKQRVSTAVSGLIAKQTEDRHTWFHQAYKMHSSALIRIRTRKPVHFVQMAQRMTPAGA